MSDPVFCIVFAFLAFAGWGVWVRRVFLDRRDAEARRLAEKAITVSPPVQARIHVPEPEEEPSPRWVMERMMDERFEPVVVDEPIPAGTGWL